MISNNLVKGVVNIIDSMGCAASALARNTERVGGTQVNYVPNINSHAFPILLSGDIPTFSQNKKCFNVDTHNIPGSVQLFDPLGFRYDPALQAKYQGNMALAFNGYHTTESTRLEGDRAFAKEVAKKVGFKVPPYLVVNSVSDVPKRWIGKVAFAKLSRYYAIGKVVVTTDAITQLLDLASKWGDTLVLEEYIDYASEVNFCFHVNDLAVQPLCVLVETNKLMTNETGGKTGTAWAYHQAITEDVAKNPIYKKVLSSMEKLRKMNLGLCGWVDVSFLVTKDGKLCFSEFMVRHAVSNAATLFNQMKVNYVDFVRAFNATGKVISQEELWRTTHSASVELYSLPIDAAVVDLPVKSNFCVNPFSDATVFDLLETAQWFDGSEYVLTEGLVRFGVLSTCFDSKKDILKHYTDTVLRTKKHLKLKTPKCFDAALDAFTTTFPTIAYRSLGE